MKHDFTIPSPWMEAGARRTGRGGREVNSLLSPLIRALPTFSLRGRRHSGFTLIELLVVVLIIGILAAIALPRYQKAVTRSRVAGLIPLTRAIQDAEERYYMANATYTTQFDDLDISFGGKHGNYYSFSGGYCSLTWWSNAVMCGFDYQTPQIYYVRTFLHNTSYPGKAYCILRKDKSYQDICQNISGKIEPLKVGEFYAYEMD